MQTDIDEFKSNKIKNILNLLTRLEVPDYKAKICMKCQSIIYSTADVCSECLRKHAAGILIYTCFENKKYVLMGRASKIKPLNRRFKIEFFGGVSENDETPEETAIRETYEETLGTINPDRSKLETIYLQ